MNFLTLVLLNVTITLRFYTKAYCRFYYRRNNAKCKYSVSFQIPKFAPDRNETISDYDTFVSFDCFCFIISTNKVDIIKQILN